MGDLSVQMEVPTLTRGFMTTLPFSIFAIALAVAGLPLVSSAQDANGANSTNSPLAFANADRNHDGMMGRSEVPKELHDLRAHFDQFDSDHDHRLSEQEYGVYLTSLSQGGCRDDIYTKAKCAIGANSSHLDRGGRDVVPSMPPPRQPTGH